MNMAEYTKALTRLPVNYKILPFKEIRINECQGKLIMAHGSQEPIIYDGDWREVNFNSGSNAG